MQTWDVRSGEMRSEFVDITTTSVGGADVAVNGHLSMDYTCLAWGPLLSVSSAKKVFVLFPNCYELCIILST